MTEIKYLPGTNPTGSCRRQKHSGCSGRHAAKYGLPGDRCTCTCHGVKKREATRGGTSLDVVATTGCKASVEVVRPGRVGKYAFKPSAPAGLVRPKPVSVPPFQH